VPQLLQTPNSDNMQSIQNNHLKITAKKAGAELTSILKKASNKEYLWQADPTYWGRHAPILFPIVGKLKDDTYYLGKKAYTMKQHGLARNLDFQLVENDGYSLCYELKSTKQTLQQYPFPFRLWIQYTLKENDLIVFYRVSNPASTPMYFSIGGHPAFNCPLEQGEKRSDYQLVFDSKENVSTQRLTNGNRNGIQVPILQKEAALSITDNLFDEDALIFDKLTSSKVHLQKGKKKVLSFDFTGFPYLGIWSKNRRSPFVCIEPWFGLADNSSHTQQLQEKEGIIKLAGKERFECFYVITIH